MPLQCFFDICECTFHYWLEMCYISHVVLLHMYMNLYILLLVLNYGILMLIFIATYAAELIRLLLILLQTESS